jgi:hypothetical protein
MRSTTASAGRTELTEERALIPPSIDDRLIGDASFNSALKCRHPSKPPAQIFPAPSTLHDHYSDVALAMWWAAGHDSDQLIDGQFARPTDDEFFRLTIEVPLPKRKWVCVCVPKTSSGDDFGFADDALCIAPE